MFKSSTKIRLDLENFCLQKTPLNENFVAPARAAPHWLLFAGVPADRGEWATEFRMSTAQLTSKIREVRHLNYWDRLTYLQMTSQQRRLERYRILYVWKVLEGLVPDCKIEVTANNRLGRMCVIPPLKRNAPAKIKQWENPLSTYTDDDFSTPVLRTSETFHDVQLMNLKRNLTFF